MDRYKPKRLWDAGSIAEGHLEGSAMADLTDKSRIARLTDGHPCSGKKAVGALPTLTRWWRSAVIALTALGLNGAATAQTATTTTLLATPNPAIVGQSVTLAASVSGNAPSGSVTFKDGTSTLGTVALTSEDPAWSRVALLLHFDTSEGTNVFRDYSPYGHAHAATTLAHDGANFKYGTASGLWTASGQLLQYPLTNEFKFGAADFTVETWANFSSSGDRVFYFGDCGSNGGGGQISLSRSTANANTVSLVDNLGKSYSITGSVIPSNTWVHIAVSRSGSVVRLFLNGAFDGSLTLPAGAILQTPTGHPTIGRVGDYAGSYGGAYGTYMVGRLDDFRITTGVARYVAAFTPSAAPFDAKGTASFTANALSIGSHSLTAVYSGDTGNVASTSSVVVESVLVAPTTTALSASPNPASFGQSVTLTAQVSGANPSGVVTFNDAGHVLATVALSAGQASYMSSTLSAGTHSLNASYGGDAVNAASNSTSVLLQVGGAVQLPAPPTSPVPVVSYEYDAEGHPTKSIVAPDSRVLATQHAYDALGRRTATTDAKNGQTQFGYDLQDQLTSVTDPRNLVTQYQPTGLGDVKQLTSPDTGVASSTFDAAGNLKTRTDARGVLATYSYDALNRPTQVVYSRAGDANRAISWTYDQTGASYGYGVGRLTTAATSNASTSFRYDALGRITTTVQSATAGNPLVVGYAYDAAGHVSSLTYPSGRVVNLGWANGQPQSISITAGSNTTPLLDQVVMSAFGPVQSWVWKLGATPKLHERIYDTSGRLVRHPLGNLVRDITYDDADRISRYTHYDAATAQSATAYDQAFSYDELDRLQLVTAATSWSYAYDANGNRTASAVGSTARGYSISTTSNRLDALTNPARTLGYDATGNTLSDVESGSAANYTATYSLEGRLASMAQGSVAGVEFGYDAMGRRVSRSQWTGSPSNPRIVTLYAYDQDNHLIGEYQADGTPLTEYVWFGDTPVAVIKTDASAPNGIQVYAIHADHLDTPRVILDASGQVRWRWMGEPFGASLPEEQPTAGLAALQQNLRFPGQQFEPFGGRFYNHFRDYDPSTGRYTQSDPIGLNGGLNTYAYVGANPLSYSDLLGLAPRKLSPDSMECRQLQDKIKRRSDFIAKYARELYENKQNLPVNPSMPGLPIRYSQLGHAERMESEMEFQKKDIEKYNEKCGCPDDDCKNGGQGANQSTPQTTPSSSSSSSSTASKVAIGGGLVVCAAACLAFPEICIPGLLLGGLATK